MLIQTWNKRNFRYHNGVRP